MRCILTHVRRMWKSLWMPTPKPTAAELGKLIYSKLSAAGVPPHAHVTPWEALPHTTQVEYAMIAADVVEKSGGTVSAGPSDPPPTKKGLGL